MRAGWLGAIAAVAIIAAPSFGQETPKQMTEGRQKDFDPVMSPDGNSLAFASNRTGDFNIFVYDYRTGGFYQLTQSPKDDRYPSWSPDSRKLLFTSRRSGKGDIYEVSANGSGGNLQITQQDYLEEYASYQPRSENVMYVRPLKKGVLRRGTEIVLADKSGRNIRALSEGDQPRFSPDGKRIVFVSDRTKNNDIWMMNADGGNQQQLTFDPHADDNPAFSPEGRHIVFASNRTGNFDIWVMDTGGGNLRQITFDPADETQPCWSVGGYIYYRRQMSETVANVWRIKAPQ